MRDPSGKVRVLVAGLGPHARTFYIPALLQLESEGCLEVAGLVDVLTQKAPVEHWMLERKIPWPRFYLPPFRGSVTSEAAPLLHQILQSRRPSGIIISTDPLAHKPYALWAMKHGLHILLDKPITASVGAVSDLDAAMSLESDYQEMADVRATHHADRIFIVCAHRRYHPGMDVALSLVRDAAQQTGCPVTNLHGYHSDGQWRLPQEILRQDHHSYKEGHGKISHSGFHFLDMLYRFRKAGSVLGKKPDTVEVTAAFLQPDGFLSQISREDYVRLFGAQYEATAPNSDGELARRFEEFGEMDVEASFAFAREGRVVALAGTSLLHGGFSRRSWMQPGEDLYKGNGRVKHEQHRVHVGPFLGLQIHSCQAKDNHEKSGPEDEDVGGNNHFELWVFRNSAILGGKPFEKITFRQIPAAAGFSDDRLFIEQVKLGALKEFVTGVTAGLKREALRSDFGDHHMPVRLMSGLYRSHVMRRNSGNPRVILPWKE